MDIQLLFHHLAKPKRFIFPHIERHFRAPNDGLWSSQLITMDRIMELYDRAPWEVLRVRVVPVSFELTGWFEDMANYYRKVENHCRQALWESAHVLPIHLKNRQVDPRIDTYWKQRKQRRCRFGARWKTFLKFVLRGMITGHCDLDILLDPFFLHYPRPHEARLWYPGLGGNSAPADLVTALQQTEVAEPWRNQFRLAMADHPGSSIDRLKGKFKSSGSRSWQ